jgi:hypothetical protein
MKTVDSSGVVGNEHEYDVYGTLILFAVHDRPPCLE